ncbi:MAG: DDE-type integrase/transposase/recombinase [Sphingobacteriales bacterium]|nr:DDE-type integrase/transposase/recombinase [Sphingobacteriales bacterium]
MNRLSLAKRSQIIQLLVEGNSLRSCSRIADVSLTTVIKLLVDVGQACVKFHSRTVVKIQSKRIECDEQWSFIYAKEKNKPAHKPEAGDIWTWVAVDADTKLIISWFVGPRNWQSANFFMNDLWRRVRNRVQLSTDGLNTYVEAVAETFGGKIDFAQLVKQYSKESTNKEGKLDKRERYIGAIKKVISGNPDPRYITTAHIERQNLTTRMTNRRFTRQVNAFSKKYDNHCYAVALNFVYYNFARIHRTLRVTPAMEAGLTKKPWKFEDIANLVEEYN